MREAVYKNSKTKLTSNKERMNTHIPKNALSNLGSIVRQLREKKNLSLHNLGYESGIESRYIQRVEKGKANIGYTRLLALLNVLGYEIKIVKKK